MDWQSFGITTTGFSHLEKDIWNEDSFWIAPNRGTGKVVALAVSDGHGDSRHFRSQTASLTAANLAAEATQSTITKLLSAGTSSNNTSLETQFEKTLPRYIVAEWQKRIGLYQEENPFTVGELSDLDDQLKRKLEDRPIIAYGTTLVLGAVSPEFVLLFRLGDGNVLWVEDDGTSRPVFSAKESDATASLCQRDPLSNFEAKFQRIESNPPALLLAATDGLPDSMDHWEHLGSICLEHIQDKGDLDLKANLERRLPEWSRHGSADDVTLGIIYRKQRKGKQ